MCAKEHDKFWEYHDKIFENQRKLGDDDLKRYATEIGLDAEKFNECFDAGKYNAQVTQDARDGAGLGVTGTPAFFINGRFLSGAQPFEAFEKIIEDELSR